MVSVASLNRDVSVTTYDINYPYRPQTIIKGQKDLITSFVFNRDETIIITASKDGQILMQHLDKCLDVYSTCPRYPVTFKYDYLFYLIKAKTMKQSISWNVQIPMQGPLRLIRVSSLFILNKWKNKIHHISPIKIVIMIIDSDDSY